MANPAFIANVGTSGDAVAARSLTDLKVFTDWLVANGQQGKGLVGEMGIPGSCAQGTDPISGSGTGAHYDPRWEDVMHNWYVYADQNNLHVTNWVTAEWNVDLRTYRTDDGNNKAFNYRTTVSSVVENHLSAGTYLRGTNLAGADFSDQGPSGVVNISHYTQPGAGYYYPTVGDWAVLYSRGVRLVRFPIRWERLQPTLLGALSADMTQVINAITAAGQAGIKVLLDQHNYGRYDTIGTGTSGGVYDIGQNAPATHNGATVGGTMLHCWLDFWNKVSIALKGNAGLWGYDLTNEPHDLTGNVSFWQEASRQGVETIRLNDQTCIIAIAGYLYDSVPGWLQQNGASAWMTQIIPAGQAGAGAARNTDPKIVWEGHHYFDNDHSGGFSQTYDSELTNATNLGFTSFTTANYVAPTTNNTFQTGPRTLFTSSFDALSDFTAPVGTANQTNSNTVTLPYATLGNPGNSMQVICTTTADEGGVRKAFATGNTIRTLQFDFYLPTGATLSTAPMTIFHAWNQNYYSGTGIADVVELRFSASGAGYVFNIAIPGTTTIVAGTTVAALGAWNTIKLVMSDTNFQTFVNGSTTADATLTQTNTGVTMGGITFGKFYGTSYTGPMYFDNAIASVIASFYAPPNGGLLTSVAPPPPSASGISNATAQPLYVNANSIATFAAGTSGLQQTRYNWAAARPTFIFTGYDFDPNAAAVTNLLNKSSAAGQIGAFAVYGIPLRDNGGFSSGGAPDYTSYIAWINKVSAAIGTRKAIICYEPDALPQLDALAAADQTVRINCMHDAILIFKNNNPNVVLYVDSGNPAWQTTATMNTRLRQVNVENSAGFSLNVSNFQSDSSNIAYGQDLGAKLVDLKGGTLGFIYDTGRNGNTTQQGTFNPPNRQFGRDPQYGGTGTPYLHGYVWVKVPGESDGASTYTDFNGATQTAPTAGQFFPLYIYNINEGDNITSVNLGQGSGMAQRQPAIANAPYTGTSTGTTPPPPVVATKNHGFIGFFN